MGASLTGIGRGVVPAGSLLFVPGAYHVWIAVHCYYETPDFSYNDIPSAIDDD